MADLDDIRDMKEDVKSGDPGELPKTPRLADMPMDWGMKNRLSRIIKPASGRTVMFAVDHGYFLGATTGLEELGKTVKPLLPYADAIMPTRGGLRYCIPPESDTPVVLRVSGGNSILMELSDEDITVAMEDAVRLNVSAVAVSVYVGAENQRRTLLGLTKMIDKGNRYGIPVLAVTAVGKDLGKGAKYLSLASRICAELGAQFVKTYNCDGFETVVRNCPVPIVMAGGKKLPEAEALQLTHDAIIRGAAGVDMGRNILQAEDPVAMIQSISAVVHKNMKPDKAHEMYLDLKSKNLKKKKKGGK
jgi:putative autoinducer-2 (AI-2) aldolase